MKHTASMLILLIFVGLMLIFWRIVSNAEQRNRQTLYKHFDNTMLQHGIKSFEVIKESIRFRNSPYTCELYRIVLNDTGHYYLYYQTNSAPAVLIPLTEERALNAVQGKPGIQA